MPGSDPSGVGKATTLTVVYSTSVLGSSNGPGPPSSTHFLSSSLSSLTLGSAVAVNTFNKLLTTSQSPQPTTSSASSSSASSVGHVNSSPISSSVTSTASTTPTFTAIRGFDASHAAVLPDASSPVAYTKLVSTTLPPTITSSTTPAMYDSMPLGSTRSALTIQNGYTNLVPVPAASNVSSSWTVPFANHGDHTTGASTSDSDSSPELISTRVLTSNPTHVSSVVGGASATSTESAGSAHTVMKPSKAPQQIVSASIPVNIQTTQSGTNFLSQTTITSGSLLPVPTISSTVFPNSSTTSNSLLSFILGSALGVLVIVALGMTVFRCCACRRSENVSNTLSSGSKFSRERNDWMMVEAPWMNAVILDRRITSYRGSSICAPEHIITRLSHAGESSQKSDGQFSDPCADSSEVVPSRTSMLSEGMHSVDSMSTNLEFTVSMDADAREVAESGGSIDASTSSLELNFVAPFATDDSSTRSLYLSPSWHYDGQSATSSPPATPKPFPLGTENARLRLHELLKEARRMSYHVQENKRSARASVDLTLH